MDPLCGANTCFSPPQSTGTDTGAGTEMPEVAASKKPEVFPRAEEGVYDEDIQQSRTRVPEDVWHCVGASGREPRNTATL